jgi:Zn-dependent protease with chaperone function
MAADFFQQQDAARRRTALLLLYFVVTVALIVMGVYFAAIAVNFLVFEQGDATTGVYGKSFSWWNPDLFLAAAVGTVVVVAAGSTYKTAMLSFGGGGRVAEMLGGRPVDPDSDDPDERRLLNIVEEMAIASGTPVPAVYLLDQEPAINAFAAGRTPGDAVIGVTRGALHHLTRDELQGVIAHEFSHILNGDMRLNLRLIGILHGILVLALIGHVLLRASFVSSGRRSRRGGPPIPLILFGAALVAIGSIGVFFGRLIKSAVSRQREYLADASAVQFTRNPSGIAGALKKIGGLARGASIEDPHAEEASHLFFGDAMRFRVFDLMSTHPPLVERIRRIDPTFDGTFPQIGLAHRPEPFDRRLAPQPRRFPRPGPRGPGEVAASPLTAAEVLSHVGAPTAEDLRSASSLIAAIPPPLFRAAHHPFGAQAVVYALLLDQTDEEIRRQQMSHLAENAAGAAYVETQRLAPAAATLDLALRVPLIDLAIPALARASEPQYRRFRENVEQLVRADRKIGLFEYVVQGMLNRRLAERFGGREQPRRARGPMPALPVAVSTLLSALAWQGNRDAESARRAYARGMRRIRSMAIADEPLPPEQARLKAVDAALAALAGSTLTVRRQVLEACTACVLDEGRLAVREVELLRAIADYLDCPLPVSLTERAMQARSDQVPS